MSTLRGQTTVTFDFHRHAGPRYVGCGVTLQFSSWKGSPYSFRSEVNWPTSDNHDEIIKSEVEQVILEKSGALEGIAVVLKAIRWDDVASSENSFRKAAKIAASAAYEA